MEEFCLVAVGDIEGIAGAVGADAEGFDAEAGIVDGAGRGSEVEDVVDRAEVEGLDDVLLDEVEAGLVLEVAEIVEGAGAEVVDADDGVVIGQQGIGEVGAEEASCSCYKYAHKPLSWGQSAV